MFAGRAQGYENELLEARSKALEEMDYETLGSDNGMIMVTCSGTAVKLKSLT